MLFRSASVCTLEAFDSPEGQEELRAAVAEEAAAREPASALTREREELVRRLEELEADMARVTREIRGE